MGQHLPLGGAWSTGSSAPDTGPSPDRAMEPWNGEVRPFDPKQSLLTTADFGR